MDYRLSVDRGHLLMGLKTLKGPIRKARPGDTATLGYDGQYLTIEARGIIILAQALGAWPGNALVNATLIAALVTVPPPSDPIIVTCDGEHVQFGPVKLGCVWQPVSGALLDIPTRREWIEAIALKYTMPRGRIVAEGLDPELAQPSVNFPPPSAG